jgi:hypothetical protein
MVAPACIPTGSGLEFLFPHILTNTVVTGVFDDGYSNRGEVES